MSGVYKRGGPSRSCPEPHSSRLSHRAAPVEWGEGSSGHRVPPPTCSYQCRFWLQGSLGEPFLQRSCCVSPQFPILEYEGGMSCCAVGMLA